MVGYLEHRGGWVVGVSNLNFFHMVFIYEMVAIFQFLS